MSARSRVLATILVLALLAPACTLEFGSPAPSAVPSREPSPSPAPTHPGSAAATMARLCEGPNLSGGGTDAPAGSMPPAIEEVKRQVEAVRELTYERAVAVQAITQEEIDRRLGKNFEKTYPTAFYDRRSKAWQALGVIPDGTSIRDALLAFMTGQVVGYYNPANGRLVYIGDADLDLTERFVLAHELTHAIDDQHFDLSRLDDIAARCEDEAFMAGLGAIEGSAQFFATQVLIRFPTADPIGGGGGGSIESVPEFIVNVQLWPYTAGQAFIQRLDLDEGIASVNRALAELPISTEQVIHPERYPNDAPRAVEIRDLGPGLGGKWIDLDVMQVGEAWLQIMLGLRLEDDDAETAAAGWDGGIYRAWTDERGHVAVVLRTVWDGQEDAAEFADVLDGWVEDEDAQVLPVHRTTVTALFASDAETLGALASAI
jgi:hypothetical protein